MHYVKIDETSGEVSWDAYFDYLRTARGQFPAALYSYAAEWEHYSLDGANSLHDAWLVGASFAYNAKEIVLEFLAAKQDRRFHLRYIATASYALNLAVEYRSGDRDVLAHEFRVEDRLIVHEIVFSNRHTILVRAQDIIPTIDRLS